MHGHYRSVIKLETTGDVILFADNENKVQMKSSPGQSEPSEAVTPTTVMPLIHPKFRFCFDDPGLHHVICHCLWLRSATRSCAEPLHKSHRSITASLKSTQVSRRSSSIRFASQMFSFSKFTSRIHGSRSERGNRRWAECGEENQVWAAQAAKIVKPCTQECYSES